MKEKIIKGSDNVFKDIEAKNPKQSLARSVIMSLITKEIQERGLTQIQAGKILDLPQSKVSGLINGKLSLFSLEHLCKMLAALGNTVYISIRKKSQTSKVHKPRKRVKEVLVKVQ